MLIVAAFVSLAIGIWKDGLAYGWIDGISICVAICIITTVNTVNEVKKENQFAKLMADCEKSNSIVIRDGEPHEIPSEEIVVGDILKVVKDLKV